MYSVFVITALKSWNLSLPRWNGHPINTAKFFGPIGDHINWVPLYQNVMCKIYCVGWFLFMTDLVNTEWHTCISASCRLYAANTALAHPRYYWCKVLFVCFFFKNASYNTPWERKMITSYSIPTMIFLSQQQAENALRGLNGKLALSKPLVVDWAKKKTGLTVSRLKQ